MYGAGTNDAAGQALDDARRFADAGKFEEALQKHIWFHNHALEIDRSYYGVRLSFALADWVELGEKYPVALGALKKIRDEKTARLVAGENNRDLFHDVESINQYLKDSGRTVETFKKIENAGPKFASEIYDLAEESLVTAKEYELAKKYLVDPKEKLSGAQARFEKGLAYAKASSNPEISRHSFEHIFTEKVVRIRVVLDHTGDHSNAKELQATALKTLDAPAIRHAVGE